MSIYALVIGSFNNNFHVKIKERVCLGNQLGRTLQKVIITLSVQITVQALLIGIKENLEQNSVFRSEVQVRELTYTKPASEPLNRYFH
jgi:hypothetical protein